MKAFFKTLLHAAVSTAVVTAAEALKTGAPITSGAVLIPALIAGGMGAIHAAAPSSVAGTIVEDILGKFFSKKPPVEPGA